MSQYDPSFKEWLVKFKDVDANLGDLARDILRDRDFPDGSDKDVLLSYIRRRTSNPVVHRTLCAALDLYHAADNIPQGL